MLNYRYRFHGYNSLNFLFKNGKTYRHGGLSLRIVKNPRRETSRVAVVISRKVLKSAPGRNRVRRRMYEAIRHEWGQLKKGYDIAILVYSPDYTDKDSAVLVDELRVLLKQADIIEPQTADFPKER